MKRISAIIFLFAFSHVLLADGAAATGADFLRMETSSRAAALAGAYTAQADTLSGLLYNPASIYGLTNCNVGMLYSSLITGSWQSDIKFSMQLKKGTFGSYFHFVSDGKTVVRENGIESGTANPGNFELTGAYALTPFAFPLTVGVSASFITRTLYRQAAASACISAGVLYTLATLKNGGAITAGAALKNAGFGVAFDDLSAALPLVFQCGLAADALRIPNHSIQAMADIAKSSESKSLFVLLGAEYTLLNAINFRIGYKVTPYSFDGFTCGIGSGVSHGASTILFNYAFLLRSKELGSCHSFDIELQFDPTPEPAIIPSELLEGGDVIEFNNTSSMTN